MTEAVRFIIITTLPESVAGEIDAARRRTCTLGGSRAALAYPPHVTLRTGALVPVAMIERFLEAFGAVVGLWSPFPVQTDGFLCTPYIDGTEEKYLVGYRVALDENLAALNRRLLAYGPWRASNRLHFQPHLTLAYDDLDREGYQRIRDWLECEPGALPSGFAWSCDNVGLYRLEGDAWTAYKVWRQ